MDFWRSIKKVIKSCTVDLSKTPDSDKGGNGVLHEEVRTGTEVPAGGEQGIKRVVRCAVGKTGGFKLE